MTPQELKNSILQLAIQGRLVEQRPEETVARGEGVELEVPPFDVPDSWRWQTLGKCCEMYTGNSIPEHVKKEKYEGRKEGFDYIGTKDVTFQNTICYNNGVRIPFENDFRRAYKDTILMCIEGGSAGRKIAILDREVCFGNKLCMFKAERILNRYLYYYLQSSEFRSHFAENMTGIIGGVSIKKLKGILIPVPPRAEQARIADKIDEFLPYLRRYEQVWDRQEALNESFPGDMKNSILQLAIQGRLVEQRPEEGTAEELYQEIQAEKRRLIKEGKIKKEKPLPEIAEEEKPFEIPANWKWTRFSELMDSMSTGPFGSMLHKSDYVPNGIPLVNPANIINEKIIPSDKMMVSTDTAKRLDSYKLSTGDLVIGRRGEMGRCAVVSDYENGWLCGTGSFFMTPNSHLFPSYFSVLFRTPYAKSYLAGESIGATMSNLNHNILGRIPIPLPPLAEQKRIVEKLNMLLPLCERLRQAGT